MKVFNPVHYNSNIAEVSIESASTLIHSILSLKNNNPGPITFSDMLEGHLPPQGGRYSLWSLAPDYLVGIRDTQTLADFSMHTTMKNYLSLEFIVEGGSEQECGGRTLHNTSMPRVYLSSYTHKGQQIRRYKTGDATRSIGLWIKPEWLINRFGLDRGKLSADMQAIFLAEEDITVTLPLTCKSKSIVAEIIDNPFAGILEDQYLQAKVTELLCHSVHNFGDPDNAFSLDNDLSRNKSSAISQVLSILEKTYVNPPLLEELAKQVGLSRSSLSSTFKSSYGMSISQYINKRKMERARELLWSSKLSILEIALAIGYDDHSSFSRAYKQYFNHTPRIDRH